MASLILSPTNRTVGWNTPKLSWSVILFEGPGEIDIPTDEENCSPSSRRVSLAFTNNARFGVSLRDCHIINIRRAFLVGAKGEQCRGCVWVIDYPAGRPPPIVIIFKFRYAFPI